MGFGNLYSEIARLYSETKHSESGTVVFGNCRVLFNWAVVLVFGNYRTIFGNWYSETGRLVVFGNWRALFGNWTVAFES